MIRHLTRWLPAAHAVLVLAMLLIVNRWEVDALSLGLLIGFGLLPSMIGWWMAHDQADRIGPYVLICQLIAFGFGAWIYSGEFADGGAGSAGLAYVMVPLIQSGFLAAAYVIGALIARLRRRAAANPQTGENA